MKSTTFTFCMPASIIDETCELEMIQKRSQRNLYTYFTDKAGDIDNYGGDAIILYLPDNMDSEASAFLDKNYWNQKLFVIATNPNLYNKLTQERPDWPFRTQLISDERSLYCCVSEAMRTVISERE